jgi:hydroxymethylbilane synthase
VTKQVYRIGTRGSTLAKRQTEIVRGQLMERYPETQWDVVVVQSTGDMQSDVPLASLAGEGIFVKELEQALLDREIDLAVHSLKDVPLTGSSEELTIAAVPERASPFDALVSSTQMSIDELPEGARVGSSSLRRQSQLLHLRPDLIMIPIRGNLDTRLKKLVSEGLDAIVVAAAGLQRLSYDDLVVELLTQIVPEPGQGALAMQARRDHLDLCADVLALNDEHAYVTTEAERAVLRALGGGCRVPIGAYAEIKDMQMRITGVVASPDGQRLVRDEIYGSTADREQLAMRLAEELQSLGADDILGEMGK